MKTQIVTDGNHKIIAVSEAVAGAEHDKKLSDKIKTIDRLPLGCEAYMDKGYQGVQKQQAAAFLDFDIETLEEIEVPELYLHLPFKKPKGDQLTQEQKEYNRLVSSIRVRVEHCIGWVKNWGIIAARFRCAHSIYTLVCQVVCGLVNRQTEQWQEAKLKVAA